MSTLGVRTREPAPIPGRILEAAGRIRYTADIDTISVQRGGGHDAQTRIYADRASGGYCHHLTAEKQFAQRLCVGLLPSQVSQRLPVVFGIFDFFSSQIIAILAAVLFPVFARAREKARQSNCLSNVKQLSLAAHMYFQDYDESLLWYRYQRSGGTLYWDEAILPYTKNEQIYDCPSTHYRWSDNDRSYGWAYNYLGAGGGSTSVSSGGALKLAHVTHPAQTIMIGESENRVIIYAPKSQSFIDTYCLPRMREDEHNEGANYGFLDGHAKWYQPSQVIAPAALEEFWMSNRD